MLYRRSTPNTKVYFLLHRAAPVGILQLSDAVARAGLGDAPELVLFHSNLTSVTHLQQFIRVQAALPYSSVVIIGQQQDEEVLLLALEAGADDSIVYDELTPAYLRKVVLLALRRYQKSGS